MCRKNHLYGWNCLFFALGLVVGHGLESGFLCCCMGIGLGVFGLCLMRKR